MLRPRLYAGVTGIGIDRVFLAMQQLGHLRNIGHVRLTLTARSPDSPRTQSIANQLDGFNVLLAKNAGLLDRPAHASQLITFCKAEASLLLWL
jgi:hypothetical protein